MTKKVKVEIDTPLKIDTSPASLTRRCLECLDIVKSIRGYDDLHLAQALKCKLVDLDMWRAGMAHMRTRHLKRACGQLKVSMFWICTGRGTQVFGPENKAA